MKYLLFAILLIALFALLFPRRVPRILRRTGRVVGDFRRAGKELATGEEEVGSPLARYEVRAGEIVEMRLLASHPVSSNAVDQARVRDIGARLSAHARRREIPYRFSVVESEEPNAFAVPGGAIFITRPLLELCEWQDHRIAGVLGHEIIHVDRLHAVKTLATTTVVRTGFRFLTLARAALLTRIAGGMEDLLVKGYRREQEAEADAFGVRVARLAGYDPRGLLELLERLRDARPEGSGPLAEVIRYFRSHPPVGERIQAIRGEIARLG